MRILGVDDDDIALDILEVAVEADGHELIRASDAFEALEILQSEKIQIVISDWMMPGMSGIELARKVRDFGGSRYTYFILLTSRTEQSDLLQALHAGADDFVVKPFDPIELRLRLRVARRVLSLETHQLTIFALARLADTRDNETGNHLLRIREYSLILAEHVMRLPEFGGVLPSDYADLIYMTSPLHDIGKVGVPDAILLKPGRLTSDEFEQIKTHTVLGGQTLAAALEHFPDAAYLRMARNIALSHHERFNGGGYPYGLAGRDIPLSARIVSVADVYDALVSKRVYKEAYPHETACQMIISAAGSQFDPLMVDAFGANMALFASTASQYADSAVSTDAPGDERKAA